jgi:hypothetical protein
MRKCTFGFHEVHRISFLRKDVVLWIIVVSTRDSRVFDIV